jgi:hypothetical protein
LGVVEVVESASGSIDREFELMRDVACDNGTWSYYGAKVFEDVEAAATVSPTYQVRFFAATGFSLPAT